MTFKNDPIDNLILENSIFEKDFHVNDNLRVEDTFCGQLKVKDPLFVEKIGNIKTPTLQVDKDVISQGNIEITSNKYHGDAIKQLVEKSFLYYHSNLFNLFNLFFFIVLIYEVL